MKTLFISILATLGLLTSGFDEGRIVLSLGVVSDVHIDGKSQPTSNKFKSALNQLGTEAAKEDKDGLDGILVVGDLIQNPYRDTTTYYEAELFKELYESVYSPEKMPLVYTIGNHDVYKHWNDRPYYFSKKIERIMGEKYFTLDLDDEMREKYECRHCVIDGCHILCITPNHADPVTYPEEAKQWLDRKLAEITTAEPDRYVLVLTHPMITGTVYGSNLGGFWATKELTPILEKYPQAVTFGGHLHFPLNDPRSIWQGSFTAFGTASTRYMAIEDGGYERMAGKTTMKDMNEYSQGLLLQFDADGNMRATRMDFFHNTTIGSPWVLDHPTADGSHLKRYSQTLRASANKAPRLGKAKAMMTESGPVLQFAAGKDDEFVHHYVITVSSKDSVVVTKKILADFYRHPLPSEMKQTWEESLGELPTGKYRIRLQAFDSWDAKSNVLKTKLKVR